MNNVIFKCLTLLFSFSALIACKSNRSISQYANIKEVMDTTVSMEVFPFGLFDDSCFEIRINFFREFIPRSNTYSFWSDGDHVYYFPYEDGYFPATIYINDCYLSYSNNVGKMHECLDSSFSERFSSHYLSNYHLAKIDSTACITEPAFMVCEGSNFDLKMDRGVVVDSALRYWKDIRNGWISYGYYGVQKKDVQIFDSMLNSLSITPIHK